MESEFDISRLEKEAQTRWLKPAEVLFILHNHENYQLTEAAAQKPPSGSLFLYNKRILKFFRKDGHTWRKKKNGRTVGEGHEKLKVGNVEALNCYYAHGEQNPNFQRRSYWMLDQMFEHIVLVHYREVNEGRVSSGSTSVSAGSSVPNHGICISHNGSSIPAVIEPYRSQSSFSPGSIEVSSDLIFSSKRVNITDEIGKPGELGSFPRVEVNDSKQWVEGQSSLKNDDIGESSPYREVNQRSKDLGTLGFGGRSNDDVLPAPNNELEYRENYQYSRGNGGFSNESNCFPFEPNSGIMPLTGENTTESKESSIWQEMSNQYLNSIFPGPQDDVFKTLEQNLSEATLYLFGTSDIVSPISSPVFQEVDNSEIPPHFSGTSTLDAICDYYVDQVYQPGAPLGLDSCLTPAQRQRFMIREVSPEWGYATDSTKVIITGSFLCNPSDCAWSCMFGDIEVPVEIIQDGVLRCQAPAHVPGKITFCITSSNRESCSESREFEYRIKPSVTDNSYPQSNVSRSTQELLLLVRFAQMLLCDTLAPREDNCGPGFDVSRKRQVDEDLWEHIIEALLDGSKTPICAIDWLLEELLKDKLQQWLSSRYKEGETEGCYLSKKEQGIIHMVAGMGFEWALKPILNSAVSVNYRDVNGWTALHWAARHGREKMVGALIASGASAANVTDPTPQDPVGKTPASIADAYGHKGLAGYLSEVALTSHLSSLTLEESDILKESVAIEAERTLESISDGSVSFTEDQLSLKASLAAVRNAIQAATRIQSVFRAHSFRKRQQSEAVAAYCDEYGITFDELRAIAAASQLASSRVHDLMLNKAALSIQKKYHGWKRRQEFLALRQKTVVIQAYVRGYQVRKRYKVIIWSVGVVDKVVLRWYRRRVGLHGFQPNVESADERDYEDMLKVFRKQKVDATINEALSQVLSMVKSTEARKQYRRMMENYWQAKAGLLCKASEISSSSQDSGENKR